MSQRTSTGQFMKREAEKEYICLTNFDTAEGKSYKKGDRVMLKESVVSGLKNAFLDPNKESLPLTTGEVQNLKDQIEALEIRNEKLTKEMKQSRRINKT